MTFQSPMYFYVKALPRLPHLAALKGLFCGYFRDINANVCDFYHLQHPAARRQQATVAISLERGCCHFLLPSSASKGLENELSPNLVVDPVDKIYAVLYTVLSKSKDLISLGRDLQAKSQVLLFSHGVSSVAQKDHYGGLTWDWANN